MADQTPSVPVDEFHGMGGAYVMVDGKRVPESSPPESMPPSDADDGDAQPE